MLILLTTTKLGFCFHCRYVNFGEPRKFIVSRLGSSTFVRTVYILYAYLEKEIQDRVILSSHLNGNVHNGL